MTNPFRKLTAVASTILLTAGALVASATGAFAGAPWSCTTSAAQGLCPTSGNYQSYAPMSDFIQHENTSSPYVGNNMWGAVTGQTQTLNANSPGDWQVVENIPSGSNPSGAVTTYPNAGMTLDQLPLPNYGQITSSFADTIPTAAGNAGWQGYDNWYNNWADEVMIQTQWVGASPCTYAAVQQFGGSFGVPVQTWGLCNFGSEKIWKLAPAGTQVGGSATTNEASGSVDITAMTHWLIANGYMTTNTDAGTTLTALSAGFEITETQSGGSTWTYTGLSFNLGSSQQQAQAPVVTTNAATGVTSSGATLNGSVNPEGQATTYQFDYGTDTSYGTSVPVPAGSAGSGASNTAETATLSSLQPSTTYHYRIEATNATDTTLGSDQTFTTSALPVQQPPTATTNAASGVTSSAATLNGAVNPNGAATTYQFDYGTTTGYGSVTPAGGASAGSGTTSVNETASLSSLSPSTTYHVRIEATNSAGTTFGSDQQFTTAAAGGGSTVAYDATSGAKKAASQTLSFTHTVGPGANRALLVEAAAGSSNDVGCSMTVKDNGVLMNKLAIIHTNGQDSGYMDIWGDVNPASGAHTISVNVANCPNGAPDLTSVGESFTGVNQTTPFSTVASATGASGIAQATVSTASTSDMVAAFVANGSPVSTARTPATNRLTENLNSNTGAGNSAGATAQATGSSVTAGYNVQADWWAAGALAVQHA